MDGLEEEIQSQSRSRSEIVSSQTCASQMSEMSVDSNLWTKNEKKLLVELCFDNQDAIEGNFSDTVTKKSRQSIWISIMNAING